MAHTIPSHYVRETFEIWQDDFFESARVTGYSDLRSFRKYLDRTITEIDEELSNLAQWYQDTGGCQGYHDCRLCWKSHYCHNESLHNAGHWMRSAAWELDLHLPHILGSTELAEAA